MTIDGRSLSKQKETGGGKMRKLLSILVLLALFAPAALAHEVRPAYLELRQTGPETYDALWKVPGLGEHLRLGLYVELPAGCTNITAPRGSMVTTPSPSAGPSCAQAD